MLELPPIGLKPKYIHDAQRFAEVCEAIKRAWDAGYPINVEWVEEYNSLVSTVKQNCK